ncbi:MAG TPA: type II toxin-antitoxin system RelE/ParE family toxin [Alphaproteobacteria bacterium]|nr:type II toxin-antitoxin system RelE/ParE family toxin [Alphaproteobacteria bacterium]
MNWTVAIFNSAVEAEIQALPTSLRARLAVLIDRIEQVGLDGMREPHVKHVDGKIWELRAKSPDGIARGFYVAAAGRRVVIVHVIAKKTQKTPRAALEIAKERAALAIANTTEGG